MTRPASLYAATKRADELLAHTYVNIHNIPITMLRFFTVYGPWGRPDMAAYIFSRAVELGQCDAIIRTLVAHDARLLDAGTEAVRPRRMLERQCVQ